MDKLAEAIEQLSFHSATRGERCQIERERRFGLATVLHVCCTACHSLFKINSCECITESGGRKWAVNLGAVWGQLVTGGAAHLAEMLAWMYPQCQSGLSKPLKNFLVRLGMSC